uniref:bifunctional DNA primase/polymerase n=1 Tax=Brevundimonas sp. TWP2-3-2 TaxID=2804648 RepID=UPI003CEB9CBB
MTDHSVGQAVPSLQPPPQAAQPPLQPEAAGAEGYTAADDWERLPLEMRRRPQWCLGGPNKQPLDAAGGPAKVNDPETWTDFEAVTAAARRTGRAIGYVITADDGLTCVDLDVKDDASPEVIARHAAIIETLDSYTERSLSGRGWHVWVYGETGAGRRRDSVEVYSQNRFIICTGDVYRDRPIVARQTELSNMLAQMPQSSAVPVALVGDDCVDWSAAAHAAADTGELGRLFRGDWTGRYESQSEADLALVKLLVPLTLSEMECWNTFRQSKLGQRPKSLTHNDSDGYQALASLRVSRRIWA